ncbi:uncharacterized protein LOC130623223 [Hydractinia symbiolongicarpus]|uniref:uncharacterized protein LOC130623223 n=1 Tax=Hydractinia symbiolongicarpus TaxID=13093 RepID=UPI00254AAE77|nr:uncharacterized protein LOC130623223 [Hydractinia symbiolongicarpus]
MVDIGDSGRKSDDNVYNNSHLGHAIETNTVSIPKPESVGKNLNVLTNVFVANDAFGLKKNVMEPYPNQSILLDQRNSNSRLLREREVKLGSHYGLAMSTLCTLTHSVHVLADLNF